YGSIFVTYADPRRCLSQVQVRIFGIHCRRKLHCKSLVCKWCLGYYISTVIASIIPICKSFYDLDFSTTMDGYIGGCNLESFISTIVIIFATRIKYCRGEYQSQNEPKIQKITLHLFYRFKLRL